MTDLKSSLLAKLEVRLLTREIEILRYCGNKDCNRMATDMMKDDREHFRLRVLIRNIKDLPSLEFSTEEQLMNNAEKQHELGYN